MSENTSAAGPLAGVRVLDMSRVLAGPFAGRMLSDLGADVVKVEPPEGDVTRLWGKQIAGLAGYFFQQNAGKRGMSVDLRKPAGAELIKRLAERADIVVENFRPGVMDRLGVGYASLKERNPKLIMLSISGFGAGGPESGRAAYAPIVHAETGLLHRQAFYTDAKPVDIAQSIADTNASLHGLVGLLSSLYAREQTGVGQHVDMAMIDASVVTDDQMHYALEDSYETRGGNSDIWDTAGGTMLISGDLRYIWSLLKEKYQLVDPAAAGATLEEKISARRAAAQAFFKSTCTDREAVIAALANMNLAWGDVRPAELAPELPTAKHRGTFTEVPDGAGGMRRITQSPYHFSSASAGVKGRAPHQGEHNTAVLEDWLEMSEQDQQAFADVLVQVER